MPGVHYEACRLQAGTITSQGLVRFQNNDYSVPTKTGRQKVWIKGYYDRVVIIFENQIIATHTRNYGNEEVTFNPLHYLELLERKAGAFEQAAPLKGWILPPVFKQIHDTLVRKDGKEGIREYIRILQYLENYSEKQLQKALEQSIHLSAVSEDAILHLLKRNLDQKAPNLALINYPNIPLVLVAPTNLDAYKQLLLSEVREAPL